MIMGCMLGRGSGISETIVSLGVRNCCQILAAQIVCDVLGRR